MAEQAILKKARTVSLIKKRAEGLKPLAAMKSIKRMESAETIEKTEEPTLLMDISEISHNYRILKDALRGFNLHYAVKANPHYNIIKALRDEGSLFETASWEEIEYLLEQGVPSQNIIFSNPVKPIAAIHNALQSGVRKFVFDSEAELYKFTQERNACLFFRISVPTGGSVWNLNLKFGCPKRLWEKIFLKMSQIRIPLSGIAFHVGSQCESIDTWDSALSSAYHAICLSHQYGLRPYALNIGGGFPIQYGREVPGISEIAQVLHGCLDIWRSKKLGIREFIAEPGRYLVGSSGIFKTSIIGISEKENKKWVFLNCGVFSGMMETIEGTIEYPVLSTGKGKIEKVMLCGPTCDSLDVLYEAEIPEPQIGDQLYFANTGAYTTTYTNRFNGFKNPTIKWNTHRKHEKNSS